MTEDLESVAGRRAARERSRAAVVDALVAERAAVLALARRKAGQIDVAVAARRLSADEATIRKQAISVFADEIAQGLHVDRDDADVRAGMRARLKQGGQ